METLTIFAALIGSALALADLALASRAPALAPARAKPPRRQSRR